MDRIWVDILTKNNGWGSDGFGFLENSIDGQVNYIRDFKVVVDESVGKQHIMEDGSGGEQDEEDIAMVVRETERRVPGLSPGRTVAKESWCWNEEVQEWKLRKTLAKNKCQSERTGERGQGDAVKGQDKGGKGQTKGVWWHE